MDLTDSDFCFIQH